MPANGTRLTALQFGVGESLFKGPEGFCSWNGNGSSPSEKTRVLDPTPNRRTAAAILKRVKEQFPALAGVADNWGAYVDFPPMQYRSSRRRMA